ncbi:MAG TPA: hypothetical protein VHV28_02475 [Solirubrobacteraceae bacterium]|jgi:hypothetical protein|nr:hypothetical protein [Solirubrobacteraceae bacterium]
MAAVLWAALAAALLTPAAAVGDGDPASDVLASQAMYVPGDGGFAPAQTARLNGLLAEARRAGIPIRVALIATRADLGSVTELWRQPKNYAEFLGQELAQVYRGTLVVAMPAGLGLAGVGGSPTPVVAVADHHEPFIAATIRLVQAIASVQGHRLTPPPAVAAAGSGSALGSVDLGSWLALAGGAVLIVLAWTASLRARPAARLRRAR